VTVDSTGEWSGHFYDVQEHDLGVVFTLSATGLTSGSSATAVFTDNRVISKVEIQNPSTLGFLADGPLSVPSAQR
jgi:hypothetical protein